jgi:hypothetical protein
VVLAEGHDTALAAALATSTGQPRAAIWRGDVPDGQDLEWEVLMRAGRTDPAPVAEVAVDAEAFVVGDRPLNVSDVLAGEGIDWPLDALGTLIEGGVVLLSLP